MNKKKAQAPVSQDKANPLLAMFKEHMQKIAEFPREGLTEMGVQALDMAARSADASITMASLTMNAWSASDEELGIKLPPEESGLQ